MIALEHISAGRTQTLHDRSRGDGCDRNLNTGAVQATSREFVSATNTILHDAEHPSALLLPVILSGAAAPR